MNLNDPAQLAVLLEAYLLAAGRPLSLERLGELFDEAERPPPARLRDALAILARSCQGRAFELKEVASGYRLQVRERFAPWVGRLWEERPQRYSRALLETLALIAYRQPISRGEIEEVRGVAVSSNIVKTLQERDWIRVVGYREVPGRPALFATTRAFLDDFNLKNLDELPPLAVLRSLEPAPGILDEEELQPSGPQALAEPAEQVSFRSLLAELDSMEQGLKTDFDDLPEPEGEDPGDAGRERAADES
ncbi:SMC-Scp complex subunit ScpB [Azotobacter beijerinckii]|uniref:Segregation and condensation protein B n=1 Tax=Azotobacter beijerinckii TaxID=170623 RepID=A0A1I3ZXE2_9GAMM|nr:SMC-Scp complex subunit ScpB [Azotobacter beijerinckii]MDV7213826.1 SMC-Scp complex subunit ScpB [Azotobacter beijerinckii]SFA84544.1 segregation and condensation protein B [Azotobacter beijerinckii]SFK48557.1 segregation and condensation protein B [Azotobacter beijerinckii]